MEKKIKEKITHKVPEVAEWSDTELEFLYNKMLDLKSKWREPLEEDDSFLFLGCALGWSKMVEEKQSLPALKHSPSYYRDLGRRHRHAVLKCAKGLAPKAQAWGGFWDPENESPKDAKGWAERKSSIAPHVWINLKKKEFLISINSPLDYEKASLIGLEKASTNFLQRLDTAPSLSSLQKAHSKLFSEISAEGGSICDEQLFHAGYVGSKPREIPWEIENISHLFKKGLKKAKEAPVYKEAEIIRWTAFTMARLLRIHPFPSGNKRLLSAWALTTLTRELAKPDHKSTKFWKNCHSDLISLRTGDISPICKKLCIAFKVVNPEIEVPSFWICPEDVTPIGIQRARELLEKQQKDKGFKKNQKYPKNKKSQEDLILSDMS